ncbi:MAG: alkaline phosphatase family protein [Bacteroidales bacterium]
MPGIKTIMIVSLLVGFNTSVLLSQNADKTMIIIIDGARYSETFGDPEHTHIPNMYSISQEGSIIDNFYNDGITYTSRAIPALWCGTWTEVRDTVYNGNSTNHAVKPTLFEYYRQQKNLPSSECYYVLKYIESLWLPSFDDGYGPEYWPEFHSVGENDNDVANHVQFVMDNVKPHFIWVYLADVDHAGHSSNWNEYIHTIQNADSIVGVLWDKVQADPFYANTTNLFVTNDHGRHDNQHGGFTGHGCNCEGCRHIQFLAVGPDIKSGNISTKTRNIPDFAVTISHILELDPEQSTGNVMMEILNSTSIESNISSHSQISNLKVHPNPFKKETHISFELNKCADISVRIMDVNGKETRSFEIPPQTPGFKEINWRGINNLGQNIKPGVYYYLLVVNNEKIVGKLVKASNGQ